MKKIARVSLLALAVLVAGGVSDQVWAGGAAGGYHGGGGSWSGGGWHGGGWHGGWCCGSRVVVGVGPFWGYPYWGWGGYWGGYYPAYPAYPAYYPGSYYGAAPVAQEPATYVSQPQPQPAPSNGLEPGYWYYCSSSRDYYPHAQSCPELWIKVPPTSQ